MIAQQIRKGEGRTSTRCLRIYRKVPTVQYFHVIDIIVKLNIPYLMSGEHCRNAIVKLKSYFAKRYQEIN